MADQVIDKKSVGIPEDFVFVRSEIERLHDETIESEKSASESASRAKESADDAREAAEESRMWAEVRHLGVHFSDKPPKKVVDGRTWLVTDEEKQIVKQIRRYDAETMQWCVFCSETTYVSETLYPRERGEWKHFKISPDLIND